MLKHLIFILLATPLAAQSPMGADAFEAYSQGKTLYYGTDEASYGAEEYLPNHRVRWSLLDGQCQEGRWYQEGELICFVYQDNPNPQCWAFYKVEGGLMARFKNDPKRTTLFEIEPSSTPLVCLGPEIGV